MLNKVRRVMAGLTNKSPQDIKIQDLLAVDTFNPQKVVGGIADEFALENAVGIAARHGYQGRIDNSWYKRSISYR